MSASHNTSPTASGYLTAQDVENLSFNSHAFPPHDPYPSNQEFGIISRTLSCIRSAFILAWSYLCGIFTSPSTIGRLRRDIAFLLPEVRALAVMLRYQGELLQRLRTSQLYLFEVMRTTHPTPSHSGSDDAPTSPPPYDAGSPTYSNIYWTADQVAETVIFQTNSLLPPTAVLGPTHSLPPPLPSRPAPTESSV
jgi:hypothetical protein